MLPDMKVTKGQSSDLSAFDMIIAICPLNFRSNFFSSQLFWKVSVKYFVNVFDKGFFVSAGIKLVASFFLATVLVVAMFDFQI